MSTPASLPDDAALLKSLLLAERAESERLRQIIKELQRHCFGPRAESLPVDQLLLALEEVEQVGAASLAESEVAKPAEREIRAAQRRSNRGALPTHRRPLRPTGRQLSRRRLHRGHRQLLVMSPGPNKLPAAGEVPPSGHVIFYGR